MTIYYQNWYTSTRIPKPEFGGNKHPTEEAASLATEDELEHEPSTQLARTSRHCDVCDSVDLRNNDIGHYIWCGTCGTQHHATIT